MTFGLILLFVLLASAAAPLVGGLIGASIVGDNLAARRAYRRRWPVIIGAYALVLVFAFLAAMRAPWSGGVAAWCVMLAAFAGPLVALTLGGVAVRLRLDADDNICGGCGYSLQGIKSERCPECGTPRDAPMVWPTPVDRAGADGQCAW